MLGQDILLKKLQQMLILFLIKIYFYPLNKKYEKVIGEYYSPLKLKNF